MATFRELMYESGRMETARLLILGVDAIQIGEPYSPERGSPTAGANTGLQEVSVLYDLKFGGPSDNPRATVVVSREDFTIGSDYKSLEAYFRANPIHNNQATISITVEHRGDSAEEHIFNGRVVDVDIDGDTVSIDIGGRWLQSDETNINGPGLTITSALLDYGAASGEEGRIPEEWRGAPIPVGYGRFNWQAKDPDPNGYLAHSQSRYYIMAPLIGLKTPCMPMALASERFLKKTGSVLSTKIPQAIYVVGDKNVARTNAANGVSQSFGNTPGTPADNFLQCRDAVPKGSDEDHIYSTLFTWNTEYDRGCPFVKDRSTDQPGDQIGFGGVGDWRQWEDPWTNGLRGNDTYPAYVNMEDPMWIASDDVDRWAGALQAIALPYQGVGRNPQSPVGPPFNMFQLAQTWSVPPGRLAATLSERVRACLENTPDSYSEGREASVENNSPATAFFVGPSFGPNLGEVVVIRACWLMQDATTALVGNPVMRDFSVAGRYHSIGPWDMVFYGGMNMVAWAGPNGEVGARTKHLDAFATTHLWFASNIKRPTDPFIQNDKPAVWAPPTTTEGRGFVSAWQFTNISDRAQTPPVFVQEYASEIAHQMTYNGDPNGWKNFYEHIWFEVIYKPSVGDQVKSVRPKHAQAITVWWVQPPRQHGTLDMSFVGQSASGLRRRYVWHTFQAKYSGNIGEPESGGVALGDVWSVGDGPFDNGSGTFTGTPNKILENAAAIAWHEYKYWTGNTDIAETPAAFGSFATARDALGTDRVAIAVNEVRPTRAHMEEVLRNQRGGIVRQPNGFLQSQLRCFIDVTDPATNAPERMYNTDGGLVKPNEIVPDTWRCYPTDLASLADSFVLHYSFHGPTGDMTEKVYCNYTETNLSTEATLYKQACADVRTNYGINGVEASWFAPWIHDKATADAHLKYLMNHRTELMWWIECSLYGMYTDLQVGHVLTFDDILASQGVEFGGGWRPVVYPGKRGAADWSTHTWNVVNVEKHKTSGLPTTVQVVLSESWEPPS